MKNNNNVATTASAMSNLGVQTSSEIVSKPRSGDKKVTKVGGRQRKESIKQQNANGGNGIYTTDKQYIVVAAARYDSSVGFV